MVSLEDIREARERLRGQVDVTPCVRSDRISDIAGAEVYLKFENLQFTGSFKERGAYNKLVGLTDEERRKGVIAASAGNHAQGVAFHASRLNVRATIVMPETTPLVKVESTRRHGAAVVLHGSNFDEAFEEAQRRRDERGLVFIHPFDDDKVIAGQGTLGLELLETLPDLDAAIVPVGGGGLISGLAVALKESRPETWVYGVEAARCPSMVKSLAEGEPITIAGSRTLADGIQVKRPGRRTYELVERYVDGVKTVSESEIADAIMFLLEREKTVVEGAGAVGVAALLKGHFPELKRKKVAVVLCGGNIDVHMLNLIIDRHLVRSGRMVRFASRVPDRPGALAQLLQIIADQGASVIQVQHNRVFSTAPFWETDVTVTLETRDPAHAEEVKAALSEAGYVLRDLIADAALDGGAF